MEDLCCGALGGLIHHPEFPCCGARHTHYQEPAEAQNASATWCYTRTFWHKILLFDWATHLCLCISVLSAPGAGWGQEIPERGRRRWPVLVYPRILGEPICHRRRGHRGF